MELRSSELQGRARIDKARSPATLDLGSTCDMFLAHSAKEAGAAQRSIARFAGGADEELSWILRRFEVEQDSFRREMDSLKTLIQMRT